MCVCMCVCVCVCVCVCLCVCVCVCVCVYDEACLCRQYWCVCVCVCDEACLCRQYCGVCMCVLSQLEDFIPDCEEFYKKKHNGRKLYWHHIMSNGMVRDRHIHLPVFSSLFFSHVLGKYELEVTTFQMVVLFAWDHSDRMNSNVLRA